MPETLRFGSNTGQPVTRRDGVAKVTGAATFAADNRPDGLLYAVYASATIARGRVTRMDTDAALAHPGVVDVMTHENRPALAGDPDTKPLRFAFRMPLLNGDEVFYANQAIAIVLGETLEAATEGARLLAPEYESLPPRTGLDDDAPFVSAGGAFGLPEGKEYGDVDAGISAADTMLEARYETSAQYHHPMEPHAVVARWEGDRLILDLPNQAISMTCKTLAYYFGVPPENIVIRTPYLGGGFGSKALLNAPQVLAMIAARKAGRPVKLVLRREQLFGPTGHRGKTRQTLRLGIDGDARLTAMDHDTLAATSSFDEFLEPASNASQGLYSAPALRSVHRGVRNDIGTPGPMRAPGEASGSAALECAMDELAEKAGLDPLEFRLRNYAEVEPGTDKPYSSKALRECYMCGAERFGWAKRPQSPRQMTNSNGHLVGWGMGTALFPAPMFEANARATIRADGTALVETGAVDMGQGAWTSLAQIAADSLGLPLGRVAFHAGTSELPDGGVAGGSAHTATAGSALHAAGIDAIAKLAEVAAADPASPLFGTGNAGVAARDGWLIAQDDEARRESFADILARAGLAKIEGTGRGARSSDASKRHAMYSHGAVFAEVTLDPYVLQPRVTRLVGAFAAGRIVNPRLAESQLMGGMIWGISFALHEEALCDHRTGRIVNGDLGGYHIPVNADVSDLEVMTIHEDDPYVNEIGVKGVGELGITGTVGAIGNAIYHATGHRIRRFPIRIEDLLGASAA
ncbi:xanthine dehydrogenase YagR molybdenum-binding subunit [Poseidonocella pacifica]|uniref:Xanthine dehydrogenase YagR molybdenum-binding subunit n=1 Tax=Poseidonocella pacifica TaxID=871651 RepID=A0A1I0XDN1_9RHOB|nr:xanthine dehydrogenase family protein molybdopterin-binding subunit [Poseidonocella pacifica]SFA98430.1 xanthine dehydrogenase YagR molybdenum-binding subunit [Poseidonocella pacifica]